MQYVTEVSGEDFSQMCMASDMRSFGWGEQDEELNFQFSLFIWCHFGAQKGFWI